ncbi:MAG: D-alanyl-D-alanine carboxypeptidase/D-alanyl-D-alanine-endopeptidase [Rhodothermales bacterium]|nr:D-alanyl-D-alanine carboxypeptidase/D-alanyl-D-alanine-endopeptidase [Rhodothermales bacterium]MBO6779791.1 D-alanyl-D-alanine carboxypeptidase/D-alanyl-D-alanine-endopeptidase [Rhodothermales bacterium]
MRLLVALLLCAAITLPAIGQDSPRNERQLRRALDRLVADTSLVNATIGVSVVDLATGRTLYAHNANKTLMPASNTKLYTTAAALDQLGADFRWSTPVYADGIVEHGVLKGNLVVVGSGDPSIGRQFQDCDIVEVFRGWADAVKAAGIRTVDGHLIGDDNAFDDLQLGYGWSWDDEPWYYSAEISALSFNDNTVDITVEPTVPGGPGTVTWEPSMTDYMDVWNATVTVPDSMRLREGYERDRQGNRLVISTRVPVGYTEEEAISVHNPTRYFLHVLRETLIAEGIAVTGGIHDIDDIPSLPAVSGTQPIARHTSVPLSDVVEVINKDSNNLYAELVLKTLGAQLPDSTSDADPGSAAMGWAAGMRTLAAARVDTARIRLADGSGLSRMNFVSPEMSTALLQYMASHPDSTVRSVWYDSLPIAGVDGTLEYRMRGTSAEGNVRAKTGTLTGASALSGYVTTSRGTPLAFSLMMNLYHGSSRDARRIQDLISETLARYRR